MVMLDQVSYKSKNKTMYRPLVSYQATDGTTYTITSETSSSAAFNYVKGDKQAVRYLKEKPHVAKIDSFLELWALPAVLLVAGLVVFLAGGATVYSYFNKLKLKKELPRTGTLLRLAGRVENKSSKNNRKFAIESEWLNPRDNKIYTFTSDNISFDPTFYIKDRLIDVWILPTNPKKKHYVDISFLPEVA